jgi:F-type H+-transporting ATPase subunit b
LIGMNKRIFFMFCLFVCAVMLFFVFCPDTLAQEGPTKGRKIWNSIMLWVNFGILAFLFIKYAKKPLMNFLYGEREKLSKKIDEIEEQVKKAKSAMEVEAEKLKKMDANIDEIRRYIIDIGQREKSGNIEKAKVTANQMIEDAQKETQYKLEAAKKRFGEEMLDIAVSLAVEELKKGISREDNEKLIEQFSTALDIEKVRVA